MKKLVSFVLCSLLLTFHSAAQTYRPVAVTGFDWDAIAESFPAASSTTGAIDRQFHVMYDVNYASSVGSSQGLPSGGTITSGTRTYQLQPYAGNNIIYLTGGQTDSLVLTTPTAYTYISLLAFATETQSTNTIKLEFTDGTVTSYTSVTIKDWFLGTPFIISGFDRTSVATDQPDFNTTDPRMYATDYTLACADQQKLLKTVVITNNSASFQRTCIAALSGVAAPTFNFVNTNPSCPASNNGQAQLTASGGTGSFTYTWNTSPAQTSSTATSLVAGPYAVSVVSGGCTFIQHDTLVASGVASPVTVTAAPDSVCAGSSSTLTASGAVSYVWSAGTPSGSTDVVTPVLTTTYTVTATNAGGCSGTATVTVTVKPIPPAPTITASGPITFCQGGSVVLSSSAATGNLWSNSTTTQTVTVSSTGTFTVTQTLLGCTSPASAPVTVTVNPIPPAPSITASGAITFCQGDSVILTSSASSGNVWSDATTNVSDTVRASGTYTVTQTLLGCTSPPSAPVTVTVNPIPPTPTISASGPTSFCIGGNVTLTSSATTGNIWNTTATTQAITESTAGSYTVTQTLLGCISPPSAATTVTIIPLPQPSIAASQPEVCGGSPVTLTASPSGASGYVWDDASTLSTLSVNAAGTYHVTVTVNGCSGTASIVMAAKPVLGPLTLPDSSNLCTGDSVTIDATTLNATSYLWSGGGETTPKVTFNADGTYTVTVSNSCGTITASTRVIVKDCNCNIYMPDAFTPNGDGKNDSIGVLYDCPNVKSVRLVIFNRWGETVYESTDINGKWDGTYKGLQVPGGVYVYFVSFTGSTNTADRTYNLQGSLTVLR